MRLIDADALKETIVSNVYPVVDVFNSHDYGMFWTGGIEKAIDEQPTIEERKTGKWIDEGFYADFSSYHAFCCSECGNHLIDTEMIYKYCPFCGARMGEVEE